MRIGTLRALSNLKCGEFLLKFATISAGRPVSELRASAEEHLSSGFINTVFTATVMDYAGRQVYLVPGAMENFERRLRFQISQEESMSRGLIVSAQIHPVLTYARASFLGLSAAAGVLANASAFIRPHRRDVFAAGLHAFFDLDFVAASRILIPEIEGNLRFLIERLEGNPYDRDDEGNFVAQGLGAIKYSSQSPWARICCSRSRGCCTIRAAPPFALTSPMHWEHAMGSTRTPSMAATWRYAYVAATSRLATSPQFAPPLMREQTERFGPVN